MAQLKVAQQKFGDSKENVKKLNNKESGGFGYNYFYLIVLFPYKLFDLPDFFYSRSLFIIFRKRHTCAINKLCILFAPFAFNIKSILYFHISKEINM